MTRRRRMLLALAFLAVASLTVGGFAWYWHTTAVDRQVRALLDEVRLEAPGWLQRWLIGLGMAKDRRSTRQYHEVVDDLAALGPPAVAELVRALRAKEPQVRLVAALGLSKQKDARAAPILIAALKDPDLLSLVKGIGRVDVAWALEDLGGAAVEDLIVCLGDDDEEARRLAADTLGVSGDPRALQPLIGLLKDESLTMRVNAAGALGRLADGRAVPSLIEGLKADDWQVRQMAAEALGSLGDARALEPLEGLLNDEDEKVRQAAKASIEQLRRQTEGKARDDAPWENAAGFATPIGRRESKP